MKKKHLRTLWAIGVAILLCAVVLQARTRKGDKFFKQGQAAEARELWDAALENYQQAVDESPTDAQYMIAMRKARFQAGAYHVEAAQKLRADGKLMEALQEFQRALVADPSSGIAIQEIKRTQQMIERSKTGTVKPEDIGLTPAEQMRQQEDLRVESLQGPPELKPVIRQIPNLEMHGMSPQVLYKTVGKIAGVHVVFDPTYQPPRPTFDADLSPADVEQDFDSLAVLTHTFWKPLSADTIFVMDDNVTKRRDYEDQVVKVFYLTNITSVQEFQEIINTVRTVSLIRVAFSSNAQKALVLRGTVDEIKLAEKLIRDLDKPKSEVVVDVIEMEASSTRTRDLAAAIAAGSGLNIPISFTPRSTSTTPVGSAPAATGSSVSLANLGHISTADFATTLPGALLQAMLSDSRTKVLNRPQIRASDGQKASLQVGLRIPYATGSFQPGVGTVGVSPLVSTQFSFIDTGVTVEITPQVHSATEVTLHLAITVNSQAGAVNEGGLSQPIIAQHKNEADIRLRDGEVNIIGGLSQNTDSNSLSGIPGLVDIPVLGKLLFGSNHTENNHDEILIALVPHIVRTPDYTPENLRGIYTGAEQVVKVTYAPGGRESAPAPPPTAVPAPPPTTPPTAAQAPPVPGQARFSFAPATVQISRNAPFTLTVQADNVSDAFSVTPLKIKFDPMQLRLEDIAPGDLLTRDGSRVTTVKDIRNDSGEATLTITKLPGSSGVSGSGALATLNFVAAGTGAGSVSITEAGLKNSQLQPIPASLGNVQVTVQ